MRGNIVVRRFALWLLICSISAAPSFAMARDLGGVSTPGMVAAILLFAAGYALATSTRRFERFHRRPFVRETLYVGYGLRLLLSLAAARFLFGYGRIRTFARAPDLFCGVLSARVGSLLVPGGVRLESPGPIGNDFFFAFVTTCVQGALLNAIVFIVMLIAFGLQRAFRTPPPDHAPRGFEVVPIADAAAVTSATDRSPSA